MPIPTATVGSLPRPATLQKAFEVCAVPQVCVIGVINPRYPRVETPEEGRGALVLVSRHIPKERLGATDDCGFSPFSIDVKPKHGSPDAARDIAFEKIAARVRGAAMASERLNV